MNIGFIIQARLGSTRLPRKILLPFFKEQTILDVLLDNLHRVQNAKIVIATTNNFENDELVSFLQNRGELIFRGSETDVLDRFIKAAEKFNIDGVVRICSDNPFLDYEGINRLLIEAQNNPKADYIGFKVNNVPSIKTHFGFWGEYVKLSALRQIYSIQDAPAHEHVTLYIYSHPEQFNCSWIDVPKFLQNRSDIRLTIDTNEDFIHAKIIYTELQARKKTFTLQDIVDYLDTNPSITQSMRNIIEQNKK